jgi:predicted metal-dependent phosphoesterase TrpH
LIVMMLGDFHMHSTFSDGKLSIPELVDLFGSRGFGAIAITDHLCESKSIIGKAARYIGNTLTPATFPLYTEILKSEAERAWKQYRLVVIPGFELTKNSASNHRSAHMLALGVTEWIDADGDPADLARAIRSKGGLAVAAHPVSTRKMEKQTYHLWDRRQELSKLFDAWEVASGPYIFNEVLESGLPMIASSDLHRRNQLTSWKTVLSCERHPEAIFDAIRNQNVAFQFYEEETNDLRRYIDVGALAGGHRSDSLRHFLSA